ncbi:TonB-dependent receptor [Hydrocarboniphaga sp.]|uniref:TonB-dependent receptor n=1 Tax=Hydrocarboniphaga sp. TaxID=2033016 RepID=UPI003D10A089
MGNRERVRATFLEHGRRVMRVAAAAALVLAAFAVRAVEVNNSADPTYPQTIASGDTPADVSQPQRAGDAVELEEIVVLGEKLGRSLAETSSSVGIATRAAIEESSDADLHDVAARFGNVVSANSDREISIRGVPQSGVGGDGDTISVYVDGVALPSRAASFGGPLSLWDAEQVEVLRGAQSTNQGRNSLAGSLVMRTREPTDYWDAKARAGLMSRDGHDYALAVGGPVGEDLSFRLSWQDRYDNGDIRNVTRNEDDAGREATRNARAKIAFKPTYLPGYSALLSVAGSDNEFGDVLDEVSGGERTQSSNERYNEDANTRTYGLEQALALGDHWTVEAITGYVDSKSQVASDYDRTEADGGMTTFDIRDDVFSQELRARFRYDRVQAVIGAYYSDDDKHELDTGSDIPVAGGAARLDGLVTTDFVARTSALFIESDWDFAERWKLTLGLRLNHEQNTRRVLEEVNLALAAPIPGFDLPLGVPLPDAVTDALSMALPDYVPPDYDEGGRRAFTDLLPKAGLSWKVGDNATLALTYQEGYRSGGTSISYFGGEVSEYDPEYTRTIELAARTRWFEDRLSLNANAFYTRWRDQQVTLGDTSSFYTTTANAGRSHLFGGELETALALPWNFEFFASLGLLKTEFDEFDNQGSSYAGNEFPQAPAQTAGVGLTLKRWHALSGQISMNYIGEYFSDPNNLDSTHVPARALLNAKLGYRLPWGFTLTAFGRNLTNNTNVQGRFDVTRGDETRTAKRYGEPRSFGALMEWELPR